MTERAAVLAEPEFGAHTSAAAPAAPPWRHRLYYSLVAAAWLFFAFMVWDAGAVVIEWPAPLGLLSYLHWAYWAGLTLVVLTAVSAFLDRSEHSQGLFAAIVLTLGLYLLGLTVFLEPNARNPDSYQNFSDVQNTLARGRIEFNEPFPVGSYRTWPAANFILTNLLLVTGRPDYINFVKYLPIVWSFLLVAIAWAIGSRLNLSPKQTFVLSFVPLASTMGWADYPATVLGHTLFHLSILTMVSTKGKTADYFVLMLLAGALIISHAIISAALVLAALGLLLVGRGSPGFLALLIAMMAIWYLHIRIAGAFLFGFVSDLGRFWFPILSALLRTSSYETAGPIPLGRLALRYSQLAFYGMYALLGLRHLVWMATHWRTRPEPSLQKALFMMLVFVVVPIVILVSQGESLARMIVLGSIWAILLLLLTQPPKALVAAFIVLSPLLLPFAQYAGEGMWPYVASQTLRGAQFFAATVDPPQPPQAIFAHHGVLSLIIHFNPEYFRVHAEEPLSADRPNPLTFDVATLGAMHVPYFILNKQGHDQLLWGYGLDPFESWPQTERGRLAPRLYDNGGFQIYSNPEARPPGSTPGGP